MPLESHAAPPPEAPPNANRLNPRQIPRRFRAPPANAARTEKGPPGEGRPTAGEKVAGGYLVPVVCGIAMLPPEIGRELAGVPNIVKVPDPSFTWTQNLSLPVPGSFQSSP